MNTSHWELTIRIGWNQHLSESLPLLYSPWNYVSPKAMRDIEFVFQSCSIYLLHHCVVLFFFKGSKRGRVKNNMYHTYPANFSGIQPLPPIQNSLEGNMGGGGDFMWPTPPPKQGTGPPVITMEPPTPQHPLLSGKSKFSQGWSSRSKTLSKSSVQCEFIRRLFLVYIESMLFH